MKIRRVLFRQLVEEAVGVADVDEYVSDLALSTMWGDGQDDEIPQERIDALRTLWEIVHEPMGDLIARSGMKLTAISARHFIPYRTLQGWVATPGGKSYRECPLHTRMMLSELLGLIPFAIE